MRPPPIALILVSLVAACAGTGVQADTTEGTAAATTAATPVSEATTSSQPGPTTTAATATSEAGRPVAPDFTLELGDGGEYRLSRGAKPVYLVFWAEW